MEWDALLLLPWAFVLGLMYWELFTTNNNDLFENPVALSQESSDNNRIGDASKRSNSITLEMHSQENQDETVQNDLVAHQGNI